MAKITLWSQKLTTGWAGQLTADGLPDLAKIEQHPTIDLIDALDRAHPTDAHFVPYYLRDNDNTIVDHCARINKEALPVLRKLDCELLFDVVVYDADDPAAHADKTGKTPASPAWRAEFQRCLAKLPSKWQDGYGYYFTRGGARLLWTLPAPLTVEPYIRFVRQFRLELRGYGIETDDFKDFGRCYRLPDVVRDGKRQQLQGDWGWLGAEPLTWQPTADATQVDDKGANTAPKGNKRADFDSKRPFAGVTEARTPLQIGERIEKDRNVTLARMAGRLRRDGLQYEEMYLALSAINARRCIPPLEDSWIVTICKSICKYEIGPQSAAVAEQVAQQGADPITSDAPKTGAADAPAKKDPADGIRFLLGSEAEFARSLCDDFETGAERMRFDRGQLWQYVEAVGLWRMMVVPVMRAQVATYDGEWIHTGVDKQTGKDKFAPLKVSHRMTCDVVKLACTLRESSGFFDGAPPGLPFANGFVRVDADGIYVDAFSPDHRAMTALPFDYKDNCKPARFLQFLQQCLEPLPDRIEVTAFLQEFIGACLIGKATAFAKVMILTGEGANGKSTFLDIVSALFPPAALTAVPPQGMSDPYLRAMLLSSRLNVVNELPETDIMESEAFKAIVDGQLIQAREIRQSPFNYRPIAGHLYAANALPNVRDMTYGFWRRVVVVPFVRQIAESEQEKDFAAKIVAAELPEITSWALQGARRLLAREHYTVPGSSVEATAEWKMNADNVALFLEQKCERISVDDPAALTGERVYLIYSQWAQTNGHKGMTSTSFGKRLKLLRVAFKPKTKNIFYGLKIRNVREKDLAIV